MYKSGIHGCERIANLGIHDKSPPISPRKLKKKVAKVGASHYNNIDNDFAITVVSQNINLRKKPESPNKRKSRGAPVVPHIKGINCIGGVDKDIFSDS